MNHRDVHSLDFINADKHLKGIRTEDAALGLLSSACRSLKMEILQRVLPPMSSHVGECDAILFSDAGILLVEVKRIGGNILKLNDADEKLRVEKGRREEQIPNPIHTVMKKSDDLRSFIHGDNAWRELNYLFRKAGIADGMPVYPVLCFGPSTNIEISDISNPNLLVTNTRTLKRSLSDFVESHPAVIGAYRHAKFIAHRWKIQGVVRLPRTPGFVRAFPLESTGSAIDFIDIAMIEGRKTGVVVFTYRDKAKKSTKSAGSIVFTMFENRNLITFEVTSHTEFSWKAGA